MPTLTTGLLLGLGIALGLVLLPRALRLTVYLTTSLALTLFWACMWAMAVVIQRDGATAEIRKHATTSRTLTAALMVAVWARGPEADRGRKLLVDAWVDISEQLAELRVTARKGA